ATYGLDEHLRSPGSISIETWIVIPRQLRRLDLLKRHSSLDHLAHPVPDDGHHVAVIRDIGGVGDPPVSGNDHGSTFHHVFDDCHIQNPVQPIDDPLNASAFADINHRIAGHVEDITGSEHFRFAELHNTVTGCVC